MKNNARVANISISGKFFKKLGAILNSVRVKLPRQKLQSYFAWTSGIETE